MRHERPVQALRALPSGEGKTLFVAAEQRQSKAASPIELLTGDGAAALLLGTEELIAEFVGSHQIAVDFVDHYRSTQEAFDYSWEERWIRDEGYLQIVPRAIKAVQRVEVPPRRWPFHSSVPIPKARESDRQVVRRRPMRRSSIISTERSATQARRTASSCWRMPWRKLARANTSWSLGFGQGCDALLFRATERLEGFSPRIGVGGYLERKRIESNYNRFLAFRGIVQQEKGIRAEADFRTPLSTLYRNRRMATGLVGGRCRQCGTPQFPKGQVCVNPQCGAFESQDDYCFADRGAHVQSWTADRLTYSPDPPLISAWWCSRKAAG